jgi:hypothetical protein
MKAASPKCAEAEDTKKATNGDTTLPRSHRKVGYFFTNAQTWQTATVRPRVVRKNTARTQAGDMAK